MKKSEILISELKEDLISHLKTKYISSVHDLWSNAKIYYRNKMIEMGGGYASIGDRISVTLNIDSKLYRFCVYLEDLK